MKKELLEELWDARLVVEQQAQEIGRLQGLLQDISEVVFEYEDDDDYIAVPLAVRIDRLLRGPEVVVSVSDLDLCNYGCNCDEEPEDISGLAQGCECPACGSIRAGIKPQGFYTGL